jgi:hypothetical protein
MVVNDFGEAPRHVCRSGKGAGDSFDIYSDETWKRRTRLSAEASATPRWPPLKRPVLLRSLAAADSTHAKITGASRRHRTDRQDLPLNQPEQDNILNYLIQGAISPLTDYPMPFTRASQDVESYDRATALEGIGCR